MQLLDHQLILLDAVTLFSTVAAPSYIPTSRTPAVPRTPRVHENLLFSFRGFEEGTGVICLQF